MCQMTTDKLIAEARKHAKSFGDRGRAGVTLEMVPKVRVLDAVVVHFESDEHEGKIEIFLERETGKFISATLVPKERKKKV